MSLWDWVGVVLFAPLLLALGILLVYIVIGLLGSRARLRRVAIQRETEARDEARDEPERPAATPRRRAPSQSPGD
jgi:hypothetical protein